MIGNGQLLEVTKVSLKGADTLWTTKTLFLGASFADVGAWICYPLDVRSEGALDIEAASEGQAQDVLLALLVSLQRQRGAKTLQMIPFSELGTTREVSVDKKGDVSTTTTIVNLVSAPSPGFRVDEWEIARASLILNKFNERD